MRISDWSSDVCSSDLIAWAVLGVGMSLGLYDSALAALAGLYGRDARGPITGVTLIAGFASTVGDRKSVVKGKSVSVRVDLGGLRCLKKKNKTNNINKQQLIT